ncbi:MULTISPECIES: hypothetical protein [unclassified Clostridium]|uniref:hypothetical protein n=1 Tax=unclassified Clostridium TaxID=2614128 RepID=UPI001A9B22B1|nr:MULTISPECIES: hypothetical protein [unclassified Clostridium]MCR1952135.1 hypothetical protein [Clostridium sp. DSM 100503]
MKEKLSTLFKDHKNLTVFIISLLLLLSFSMFFIIYNSDSNRAKRTLKSIGNELNTVNTNLESGIKDLTIDTTKSYDLLVSGSNKLKELLNLTSQVEDTDSEISSIKNDLSNAISSTISLYDNCINILSNPKDITSSADLDNFNSFKEICLKDYSILAQDKINIDFSNDTLQFFDNTYNYLNTIIKVNRDSEFQNTQQREFFLRLDSFNSEFNSLNEDLMPAINKIREDKRDLQVIVEDLYSKEKSYENLKSKIISMSIPDGCMDIYDALDEYFNMYYIYLKSIKEAVIYEKTCSDIDKFSKEINKNYKNATSKRNDVIDAYSNYKNILEK